MFKKYSILIKIIRAERTFDLDQKNFTYFAKLTLNRVLCSLKIPNLSSEQNYQISLIKKKQNTKSEIHCHRPQKDYDKLLFSSEEKQNKK
ncbi:hypothetical protein BpHYR1_048157 [Brachionus plicatilis]|uniref:Uncharacterized protein n=1 Tax=Brachionus plicatilis TaxID=10195 RepID=A0A3M7P500_BRAPC|nr:hypothetical protein BpHYR1_048157 [Brachionus plicatilis]